MLIDRGNGTIKIKELNNITAFLIPSDSWATIRDGLHERFGSGAWIILRGMGQSSGQFIAKQVKMTAAAAPTSSQETTPGELFTSLSKLAAIVGWGKVSIWGDLSSGREVVVTIRNCPFCEQLRVTGEEECYFYAGVVQGVVDELYGGSHNARETRCRAKMGDVCEIIARSTQ